ncbi:hypothetical protein [Fibrella forsythiae]|uniref:DUF4384 domain-containing protein n=1 Tax=Fibrella forsythiae TaxID=2817061 RepID=A0ABS3JJZ1_9BACT|nr:hypothetical protein [Fibrella forsythiae]MBO0950319.1 hypothetical protein [Fibrella forsythiae]
MKKQLIILGLTLCAACKPGDPLVGPVLATDAAKVIAGTYAATDYVTFDKKTPFPINGKTVTFQIERIAPDTVRVRVKAPANDLYSPARDTTYNKVYVLTKPQGYYLTLETNPTQPNNQLGSELVIAPPVAPASSPNWASYVFAPPGFSLGRVSVWFTKVD